MRVVIDAWQAGNRSGTGRYVEELIPALAALDAGLELHAVLPGNQDLSRKLADVDPRILRLHPAGRRPWSKAYSMHVGMPGIARRYAAELVHYTANVGELTSAAGSVLTVHDLSFLEHPEWFAQNRAWYYRAAVPRSARSARRVIAVSRFTADSLLSWLGLPEDRVDVVHNGLSPEFQPAPRAARDAVRNHYGLPERYFLYVGTLEPRKNIPRLIAAWSSVVRDTACDLVIAGREGWKVGPVRAAAETSPHRQRIHFPGFVAEEHLPALLSDAVAFAWPSLFEGFGWPPLEAMACGAPVVTSDTSSIPEIVGDGALTVDPYDEEAIADALRRIAEDETTRDALREKGRARAALFSWDRAARETLKTYNKAMA
ncbi:MAG: glycosyltransferase family 4 protein [Candidatus Hydrogenedentes bacterium]|nr:glycosyltransferase family 4 protein [Candidatus Hydrogenedentota bacterium]